MNFILLKTLLNPYKNKKFVWTSEFLHLIQPGDLSVLKDSDSASFTQLVNYVKSRKIRIIKIKSLY